MKKLSLFIASLVFALLLQAQSLPDGKQQYRYQRYQSAGAIFHDILNEDRSNAEAWMMMARNNIQQEKLQQANDSFSLAPAAIHQAPFYLIGKGALLLADNKLPEATAYFQQAIGLTKGKDVEVLEAIADVNIESSNGDYNYAAEVLQKAIKRDKKNASLETRLGQAFMKLHNGSEAYRAFMKAIDKNSKKPLAYYELGKLFLSQKNTALFTEYFEKAIAADPSFGPGYYELYNHYAYLEPVKAASYFDLYKKNSDYTLQQDYSYTDLLYLTKKYDSAIAAAKKLIRTLGTEVQPRLYKLISYAYQAMGDSASALPYMVNYFERQADSSFVQKDYETMALLYNRIEGKEDSVMKYYEAALSLATQSQEQIVYYKELARLSNTLNRYDDEAVWLGKRYLIDPKANNVLLFNWGLAAYKAQDYQQADSAFRMYTDKYPEQGFGYFWRARANAAIDTTMMMGLAVPHYLSLVKLVEGDTLSNTDKKWMKEAYSYLAGYEANTEKDYAEAINYFEKLLVIDPDNEQVERNIEILEKNLAIRNRNQSESN